MESPAIEEIIEENSGLTVKLGTDYFCIGNTLSAKIKVDSSVRMRGVRFEIITNESARANEVSHTRRYTTISGYLKEKEIKRGDWTGIEFDLKKDVLPSMNGALFDIRNDLRITLDVPFGLDIITTIPINLVFCTSGGQSEVTFDGF